MCFLFEGGSSLSLDLKTSTKVIGCNDQQKFYRPIETSMNFIQMTRETSKVLRNAMNNTTNMRPLETAS